MIRSSLTGIVVTAIIFISLAALLASQITINSQPVTLPGFPESTEPVTLLEVIADALGDAIGDFLWPW